jgi:hypothetical protein
MNCRKVSRWFSAYIDGDLLPQQTTQLEEHLSQCGQCREKLADLRLIVQTAGELEKQSPGPYFVNRLICAVNANDQPQEMLSSWKFRLTLSGMAFVVAACMTLVFFEPTSTNISLPIPGNNAAPIATTGSQSIQQTSMTGGFPVPAEALKRDMAMTESLKSDSIAHDTIILSPNYMRQVDLKRGN